ncbi:MAG: hypothetical protein R2911_02455 [Caldilineaceae bacterium]
MDRSFFPNVGTSGIYTSNDGGQSWTNRGLLDDQPTWIAPDLISDGDPVIVYGPKPMALAALAMPTARAYYATLASYKSNNGLTRPIKRRNIGSRPVVDNGVT